MPLEVLSATGWVSWEGSKTAPFLGLLDLDFLACSCSVLTRALSGGLQHSFRAGLPSCGALSAWKVGTSWNPLSSASVPGRGPSTQWVFSMYLWK